MSGACRRSTCSAAARTRSAAFLYAFDLLEPGRHRPATGAHRGAQATLASILRKARHGVRLNEHLEHPEGDVVFRHACKMGLEGHRLEAPGLALPIRAFAGLAQV